MEEIFEMLLQLCMNEDVTSLEVACIALGLNFEKILEYSTQDQDAQTVLKMCCSMLKDHVHAKFYNGTLAKNEADNLIAALEDIVEIYLNVSLQPPLEE